MSQPEVSIVMPVRNAAGTVEAALASIVAQSFLHWETIVVDDGSSDETAAIVAAWTVKDARIRLIRPAGRPGLVGALNRGLAESTAPLIARMDADDVMHPQRLAKQVEKLTTEPALGLVSCRVGFGGDVARQAGYAAYVEWLNALIEPAQIRLARFVESPLAHPSVMFRRALVSRHGGYRDGHFPEDYELWLRWLEAGERMAKLPDELLVWRDSPGRASRVDSRYAADAFFETKAVYLVKELQRSGGGREVWIAGAGRPTRKRAMLLEQHGVCIAGFVDIDPRKIGGNIGGRPVVGPAGLPSADVAVVLSYVSNRGAREVVRGMLSQQGRVEGRDFWLCG